MDLNKAGFYIGFLALLLAVPLSVAANLLTPRISRWWGTTSTRRREKRISRLTTDLEKAKNEWVFSPAEWETYKNACLMGVALSLLGEVLLVFLVWAASIALFAFEKQIRELDAATKGGLLTALGGLAVIVIFGYAFNNGFQFITMIRLNRNRKVHTLNGREEMEGEIQRIASRKVDPSG